MCLNLVNSKYENINEVEYLLNNNITEKQIIAAKDSREKINDLMGLAASYEYLDEMGL